MKNNCLQNQRNWKVEPSAPRYFQLPFQTFSAPAGTQNNDIAEGTAIKRLFDPQYPKMSSTKAFTGHTLGASGGIEAVFSVLSLQHGIIYPNLRLETPMKDLPFTVETKFIKNTKVKHVLSNSFGFGGNCSSLIFSKV